MRARQFLALQGPILVRDADDAPLVVLAFTIGVWGRVNAMVVEPANPSRPRTVPVDRLTFPAAIQAGPIAGTVGSQLGAGPTVAGGPNREQRRRHN